jgi:hypothetical protein
VFFFLNVFFLSTYSQKRFLKNEIKKNNFINVRYSLNGINLPLAYTGQEYIYAKTFKQFGVSDEDLEKFFTGPAFLTWNRGQYLRGWGGPLR